MQQTVCLPSVLLSVAEAGELSTSPCWTLHESIRSAFPRALAVELRGMRCTRRGCNQDFDDTDNKDDTCSFHPGHPVFHEGLKSYACCKDINKPVLDFDDFMKIPPCATGSHSSEPLEVPAAPAPKDPASPDLASKLAAAVVADESSAPQPVLLQRPARSAAADESPRSPEPAAELEQDPIDASVQAGMRCKRKGCPISADDSLDRNADECRFHPGDPVFHEGSKGYSCCKKRVLDFGDFLALPGCSTSRHLFVGRPKPKTIEPLRLRHDFYQTPKTVIASVFGKKASKEDSRVIFEQWQMHVDLRLPDEQHYQKTFSLYGPIDPIASTYVVLGTKIEINLVKADSRSWPELEEAEGSKTKAQITFGVANKGLSVGQKQMILDETNALSHA
ncbi:uncharacterized protein L969DRAFT_52216 [Mixia osmundae IAM 14324]|uniref:CS domain-containing protein n=1 Tax=Mixia osmundae (strain CBS 9802 / IAM 14324 / JCM 22182 / KY 12970) TaxID=764103 RepID=G7E516_MIXOS|nr:uncharacterized protein L969DRAFT_52216 [Mixia osmundae IAM 14324]KEI37787.1 hypothetical protein L969DRAFT_52216 [Mixia osmundae IAM 14324]GAA97926.1 hypothetical protein E5Q_04606 [Mixia osmundae IAM 14324]